MSTMKCSIQINYPIIYVQLTMHYETKTDLFVDPKPKKKQSTEPQVERNDNIFTELLLLK